MCWHQYQIAFTNQGRLQTHKSLANPRPSIIDFLMAAVATTTLELAEVVPLEITQALEARAKAAMSRAAMARVRARGNALKEANQPI